MIAMAVQKLQLDVPTVRPFANLRGDTLLPSTIHTAMVFAARMEVDRTVSNMAVMKWRQGGPLLFQNQRLLEAQHVLERQRTLQQPIQRPIQQQPLPSLLLHHQQQPLPSPLLHHQLHLLPAVVVLERLTLPLI